jgi:membrane protein DedA with SNARE-associated domain
MEARRPPVLASPGEPGARAPDAAAAWLLDPEQRRIVRICVSALATLSTASMLGVASSLYLVNHYPLLLVALSPIGRHLLLVAPTVDPIAFVAVVVARRMLFYLASFHLGRALGPAGIVWIEARAARLGRFVRWLERLFRRASHAVVFFLVGPTVSALAGASGMRPRVFASLAAPGLVVRALLVLGVAASVRHYIEAVLAWIEAHWVPGTVVMVALVAVYRWRRRRPSVLMED